MTLLAALGSLALGVYALYRVIVDALYQRRVDQGLKKITLLDTLIEAKNSDLVKKAEQAKKDGEEYENRRNNPTDK